MELALQKKQLDAMFLRYSGDNKELFHYIENYVATLL